MQPQVAHFRCEENNSRNGGEKKPDRERSNLAVVYMHLIPKKFAFGGRLKAS